ncbi:hypothetical protein L2K20_22640 [Mycobacterium sp. MBM]|nr:hypothetical protein [Mycobacterium sp. MBM]
MRGVTGSWTPLRRAVALAGAVLIAAAGCGSAPEQQGSTPTAEASQSPNWPSSMDGTRFRWSAAPDIDLLSGPAVPLRAYVESRELASKMMSITAAYPGFARAVPFPPWQPRMNSPAAYMPDEPTPYDLRFKDTRLFGNDNYRIMAITPQGNGLRAVVCLYRPYRYALTEDGRYKLFGYEDGKPHTAPYMLSAVDFTQEDPRHGPNPPPNPTVPQEGPLPAPVDDVFGDWVFTALSGSSLSWWINNGETTTETPPEYHVLLQRCIAEMPVPEDQRADVVAPYRDTPPPTLPAYPGWPARAQ